MSEKKEPGGLYTTGYHGTSVEQAMRIVETGFDTTAGSVVFFPAYETKAARHRAIWESVGQPEFALVEAVFPTTPITYDTDFDHQLEIAAELVDRIEIVKIMAWQMQANSGIPPRQLYPSEVLEFDHWWLE